MQNSALGEEIKRAVGDAPQKHGSDEKEKSNGGNRRFHRNERTRDVPVPPCCQVASKYHSLNKLHYIDRMEQSQTRISVHEMPSNRENHK